MRLLISFTVTSGATLVSIPPLSLSINALLQPTSSGDLTIHIVEPRLQLSEHRIDPIDELMRRRDVGCLQCVFAG